MFTDVQSIVGGDRGVGTGRVGTRSNEYQARRVAVATLEDAQREINLLEREIELIR